MKFGEKVGVNFQEYEEERINLLGKVDISKLKPVTVQLISLTFREQ